MPTPAIDLGFVPTRVSVEYGRGNHPGCVIFYSAFEHDGTRIYSFRRNYFDRQFSASDGSLWTVRRESYGVSVYSTKPSRD